MGAEGGRAKTRPPTSGRSGSDARHPPDLQGFRHWRRLRWIAFFHARCGFEGQSANGKGGGKTSSQSTQSTQRRRQRAGHAEKIERGCAKRSMIGGPTPVFCSWCSSTSWLQRVRRLSLSSLSFLSLTLSSLPRSLSLYSLYFLPSVCSVVNPSPELHPLLLPAAGSICHPGSHSRCPHA